MDLTIPNDRAVGASSMSKRVVVVQHIADEGLGRIAGILRDGGWSIDLVEPEASVSGQALRDAAGLIVLGGPMAVYEDDKHPRLKDEQALIREALALRVPMLGICLGSQLLAATLGARVCPGATKEIGWHDVFLDANAKADALFAEAPSQFKALHWHGDIFDLPEGAVPLARSAMTRHQAFSYDGIAWGLLFHLEAGVDEVAKMANAFPEEVAASGNTRAALLNDAERYATVTEELARRVFSAWLHRLR